MNNKKYSFIYWVFLFVSPCLGNLTAWGAPSFANLFEAGNYEELNKTAQAKGEDFYKQETQGHATPEDLLHIIAGTNPLEGVFINPELRRVVRSLDMGAGANPPSGNSLGNDLWHALYTMTSSAENEGFHKATLAKALLHLNKICPPHHADPEAGVKLLQELAERGYTHAHYWLGLLHMTGAGGVEKDWFTGSIHWGRAKSHIQALKSLSDKDIPLKSVRAFIEAQDKENSLVRQGIQERVDADHLAATDRHIKWGRYWSVGSNVSEFFANVLKGGSVVASFVAGGIGSSMLALVAGSVGTGGLVLERMSTWSAEESSEHTTALGKIADLFGVKTAQRPANGSLEARNGEALQDLDETV